jgi:magnesium transporter
MLDAAVDWALYRNGMRQPVDDFDAAVAAARVGEGFVWIGLHEPTHGQLTQLGEVFGLHALALEDASNPRQRPKLERRDETLFLAMRTLAYVEREARGQGEDDGGDIVETGAVMVFLGGYFVATIRHGRHASMVGLRRRLESNPAQLALGPSSVLHAVADKVVDDYLGVTDAAGEDIEEIESRVFAPRAGHEIERIYQLKRDVIEMKRTVDPLGPALHELAERPRRLVHPEIREYFRDVADHHARVREQVASFDELLTSILQAAVARLSIAENEDMRKISAWVAIAAVPTMIAGIYGMNFQHMPELSHTWGYPAVLAVMAVICGALYRGFKRNRWL